MISILLLPKLIKLQLISNQLKIHFTVCTAIYNHGINFHQTFKTIYEFFQFRLIQGGGQIKIWVSISAPNPDSQKLHLFNLRKISNIGFFLPLFISLILHSPSYWSIAFAYPLASSWLSIEVQQMKMLAKGWLHLSLYHCTT